MGAAAGPDIIEDGLVLCLDVENPKSYSDSENNWKDLSKKKYNSTINNSPIIENGFIYLDGIDDSITISSLDLSQTNAISISFWCKLNNYDEVNGSFKCLLEFTSNYNNSNTGFVIGVSDDSNSSFNDTFPITLNLKGNNGYNLVAFDKILVNDFYWHYWVAIFDKSLSSIESRLFIDGEERTPSIIPSPYRNDNTNNFGNNTLFIGGRAGNSYMTSANFNGISIYDRSLTESEIKQNYNSFRYSYSKKYSMIEDNLVIRLDSKSYSGGSVWEDTSPYGNNATLVNGVNYSNGFFNLDGVNDYILTPRIPYTGTSTTSVSWGVLVNPQSSNGNIMSMSSTNPQGSWNMPPIAASSQRFFGKIWSNSLLYSNTFSLNEWYYLVLVWNYSTDSSQRGQYFYVNGELVGSQTNISYNSSNNNNYIFLGQSNPGGNNTGMFAGKYAAFHVYGDKALSQFDVVNNYMYLKRKFKI